MTDERRAALAEFLDGDDGVWYDRFGLWTQGKRDTAWLAAKIADAGWTLVRAEAVAGPDERELLVRRLRAYDAALLEDRS